MDSALGMQRNRRAFDAHHHHLCVNVISARQIAMIALVCTVFVQQTALTDDMTKCILAESGALIVEKILTCTALDGNFVAVFIACVDIDFFIATTTAHDQSVLVAANTNAGTR